MRTWRATPSPRSPLLAKSRTVAFTLLSTWGLLADMSMICTHNKGHTGPGDLQTLIPPNNTATQTLYLPPES